MAVGLAMPLAHDVRRRAVARLEHRVPIADVRRGRHAHAADQSGGEIREDVAEHVLHDQDVELPGLAYQHGRARINIERGPCSRRESAPRIRRTSCERTRTP